jgi:hypothetical protein
MTEPDKSARLKAIRGWLRSKVAAAVGTSPDAVGWDDSFFGLGLESQQAVRLAAEIGSWLGVPVEPMTLFHHPTVTALSAHLADAASRSLGG